MTSPPVKDAALRFDIPVLQPETVNTPDFISLVSSSGANLAIVVAFGQILSSKLLKSLPLGFFNIHLSLLPELRGAAPVQWSIAKGLKKTGVTIFRIVRELDAGPILCCEEVDILPSDTTRTLFDKLYEPSLNLVVKALEQLCGDYCLVDQIHEKASVAPKLESDHGLVDFRLPAWKIERMVRGFGAEPGTYAFLHSNYDPVRGNGDKVIRVRFLNVTPIEMPDWGKMPGIVISASPRDGMIVQAGLGVLRLDEIRPNGRKTMSSAEFVRGYPASAGDIFLTHGTEQ